MRGTAANGLMILPSSGAIFAAFIGVAGCSLDLPEVDPSQFACFDDTPLDDGTFPCPPERRCVAERCAPRLACYQEGRDRLGCNPDAKFGDVDPGSTSFVCDLVDEEHTSSVGCVSGVPTVTSTPAKGLACDCPMFTHCVAFAARIPSESYPLFVLPRGGELPVEAVEPVEANDGVEGSKEVEAWRVCTRACGSEFDCPADHTCRPAFVVGDSRAFDATATRHTVGVCYPNRLVETSSTSTIAQPNPLACRDAVDCSPDQRPCRFRPFLVSDHPVVPAQDAWGQRFALESYCAGSNSGGSTEQDLGCVDDNVCVTGLCHEGRCAIPCDPADNRCPAGRLCLRREIMRRVPPGVELYDMVHLCERR